MPGSTRDAVEGRCPNCRAAVPRGAVLIEYDTPTRRRVYADCPECGDVVRPE